MVLRHLMGKTTLNTAQHFVYKSLTEDDVIAEIVRLAEASPIHREYCSLACEFIEDCKVAKNAMGIEKALAAILKISANHSRISTILRYACSCRNALENWYATRDAAIEILRIYEPERYERLLVGLLAHQDPGSRDEMDGLNAWESIQKEARKYA